MAKLDLRKSVRGLSFLTKLNIFGSRVRGGDQMVFDRRGAIQIRDQEITKRNGEVVKIRGVMNAGGTGNESMAIRRPSGGSNIAPARAMEAIHGWSYAAIKAISEEISNIEFKCFRVLSNGEHEELEEHDILDFLDAVNDTQTGPEFKQTLAQHLEATGNAYILLQGVSDELSKPKSMYLLDPSRVKVKIDRTTYPFRVTGYTFTIDSRDFTYFPYEIVHLKYPDPNNPHLGMGTIQGIAEWVDNDNDATEFLRQFFRNGATIGLAFETDMTSEEQLMTLRDSFNEQHEGVQNAYRAVFLPKGVKKPSSDIQIKDLGIPQIADTSRDRILAGFRVSKTILGTAESDTNRSTAETADYVFSRRTIKPKMILICSYLNEFLAPRFGDDIYLTFLDPVPQDKTAMTAEMTAATGGSAIMTVNEARDKFLGLGPVQGGDSLPSRAAPVDAGSGEGGNEPIDDPTQAPQKAVAKTLTPSSRIGYRPSRVRKGKTQFSRNVKTRKEMSEMLAQKIADIIMSVKKKSVKDMTRQEYHDVILKEKLDRTDAEAKKIKAKLQELNNKQKEEVLKNLPDVIASAKAINASKLFDLKGWISLTIDALTPIAKNIFKNEATQALELIDKPGLDVENTPAAKAAIKQSMSLMAQSYNEDTINKLEAKINEGLEAGYSNAKMADLVSDIYAWKDESAAERVALTESNRIANAAGKIAWKESGVVKKLEWVTSKRDNVCSFCQSEDGTEISINDNFYDKGDTITDDDGMTMANDYSDIGGPPLHPNCHCGMRPIVDTSITLGQILPEKKPEPDPAIVERLNAVEAGAKAAADALKKIESDAIEMNGILDSAIKEIDNG